jgi:Flp pilus assembly protein TadG
MDRKTNLPLHLRAISIIGQRGSKMAQKLLLNFSRRAKAVEPSPAGRRLRRWLGVAAELRRTKRSAVALELAIAALPFFLLFLGTMEISYDLYVQSAMNYIADQVALQIYEGNAQQHDPSAGGAAFVSTYVCPIANALLECNKIQMNIQPVPVNTDFWNYMKNVAPPYVTGSGPSATLATSTWNVCTGGPNTPVLLQAVYAGPTFIGAFIPDFVVTWGGGLIHPTYATQAFVNQGFPATAACT